MDNGASCYLRFLDGDDRGLVELIRAYKDGLILFLHQFTGDYHTAEDLMEDTFVKLAIRKPGFSGRSTFKTWLYSIARNTAMDHLRRHRRVRVVSQEELKECESEGEDLERHVLRQERKVQLHRSLEALKPEYRQVLHLTFFEGFSNAEAALIMGRSRRQIENLIYRAKHSLRSRLEKEGFTYEEL